MLYHEPAAAASHARLFRDNDAPGMEETKLEREGGEARSTTVKPGRCNGVWSGSRVGHFPSRVFSNFAPFLFKNSSLTQARIHWPPHSLQHLADDLLVQPPTLQRLVEAPATRTHRSPQTRSSSNISSNLSHWTASRAYLLAQRPKPRMRIGQAPEAACIAART